MEKQRSSLPACVVEFVYRRESPTTLAAFAISHAIWSNEGRIRQRACSRLSCGTEAEDPAMCLVKSGLVRLCFVVAILGINPSHAAEYFVSTTGNNGNSGANVSPWRTLQHAANQVQPGDRVTVLPGNYTGFHLTADGLPPLNGNPANPIEFFAQPGVMINVANPVTNQDGINLENASWVVIDGFSVAGMDRAGVRSVGVDGDELASHVTIRNVTATNNDYWGILTGFVDDLLIENNKTSGSSIEHGIYVSNSGDRPVIRNNESFSNFGNGIHMNGDASLGGDGMISNALVSGNKIYNNGLGGGSGINMDGVQDSRIENNLLYDNHSSGISLYKIDGAEGSSGNVVINNTVHQASNGRWALNIQHDSSDNTVLNNILITDHSFRGAIDISDESLPGFTSDYNVMSGRLNVTFDEELGIEEAYNLTEWQDTYDLDLNSIAVAPAAYSALFANLAADNYQLSATSLARDSGTSQLAPLFDFAGHLRPMGAGFDRGAYEYVVATPGDFDADGDVDGRDLLVWQRNQSVGSLADWRANYGAGALSASYAVPEPKCLTLMLLGSIIVCLPRFRRSNCATGFSCE
jgi:parallel beta-helix repeat protein